MSILTHTVDVHNGVTSRSISNLLHETIENITVALNHGTCFVENVLA